MYSSLSNTSKTTPLFPRATAWRMLVIIFIILVAIQVAYVVFIGSGVGKFTDGFSEGNTVRAAEAYLKDGFKVSYGLPRSAYGDQCKKDGFSTLIENDGTIALKARKCLPPVYADPNQWVYTHYPEGSEVIMALIGHVVGLRNIQFLRLFPLGVNLLAAAVFFFTIARAFGPDRGFLVAVSCVLLPAFNIFMPCLSFESYSFALVLFQLSLIIHAFWLQTGNPKWTWVLLFTFGFLQGWLTFDEFFVVSLMSVPLWLIRKSEGHPPSSRWLLLSIILPFTGFGLAHALHFLQVIGVTGSIAGAVSEYLTTASERGGSVLAASPPEILQKYIFNRFQNLEHHLYISNTLIAFYGYVRSILHPGCLRFSLIFPLVILPILITILFRSKAIQVVLSRKEGSHSIGFTLQWSESGSAMPALGAALFVSFIWMFVMPAHSAGNLHITVQHLFIFYLIAVLIITKSIHPLYKE